MWRISDMWQILDFLLYNVWTYTSAHKAVGSNPSRGGKGVSL